MSYAILQYAVSSCAGAALFKQGVISVNYTARIIIHGRERTESPDIMYNLYLVHRRVIKHDAQMTLLFYGYFLYDFNLLMSVECDVSLITSCSIPLFELKMYGLYCTYVCICMYAVKMFTLSFLVESNICFPFLTDGFVILTMTTTWMFLVWSAYCKLTTIKRTGISEGRLYMNLSKYIRNLLVR